MNRIRELREKRELRQIDLSRETGIDQKTISNYETGKTNPDSYALIRLADFFGVSIDYLVGRIDMPVYDKASLCRHIENIKQELDDIVKCL